jgi:hypothetical protein
MFAAANANAQILSEPPAGQPAPPAAQPAPAPVAQPAPVAPAAAAPVEPQGPRGGDTGESDHDRAVGHVGVTYFGISDLPIGAGGTGNTNITAPVLGIRYWLKSNIGIDGGLGFGLSNGSTTVAGTSVNNPSAFGLLLHAGVPIVLGSGQHYAFELIPEATIGFASGTVGAPPGSNAGNTTLSGFRLDLGARAGGEIHFGFMGVPQLSLVATVGLFIHDESWSTSPPMGGSSGAQTLTVATSVQNNPWSIFTDNISAVYYF